MSDDKMIRLNKAAKEAGVSVQRAADFLASKGFSIDYNPNSKITTEQYNLLLKEFESSANDKREAEEKMIGIKKSDNIIINAKNIKRKKEEDDEEIFIKNLLTEKKEREKTQALNTTPMEEKHTPAPTENKEETETGIKLPGVKVIGKINLEETTKKSKTTKQATSKPTTEKNDKEDKKKEEKETTTQVKTKQETEHTNSPEVEPETELIKAKADTLKGLSVVGKIDLPQQIDKKKKIVEDEPPEHEEIPTKKRKRLRIKQGPIKNFNDYLDKYKKINPKNIPIEKQDITEKEIQEKIKDTLAKLTVSKSSGSRSKYRKEKRNAMAELSEEKLLQEKEEAKTLRVTEFISANDLASLMNVSVNEVISMCMSLGMFISINQRLDAEAITIIADEFGYKVQFTTTEEELLSSEDNEPDDPASLQERAPIVTIMGHVDHGKTSLLDYIRKSNVVQKEAGGITQHIGAYDVVTPSGKKITFLDTPGHEAFTAMRARGAKITDIVVIVVAADDSVMPQTKEAINHALIAGVPIIIAINKIDKPQANPDKIKEELAKENILVEDWGGKYQCELISAKTGKGIPELLEKILLEAEILQLKANPHKKAVGTIIEASLDKGRGYLATVLVQQGTLRIGDVILAGSHYGKVKAMMNHTGERLQEAGPSTPVQVLGLNGAPQAGDKIQVLDSEREAREIAAKREQLIREQSLRTRKHITLDEIGRRLAIGSFKELNIIVKGDVDGSVEALSDSLLKLSTEEIQVRIIHKGVGAISESDVLLASASDAVIVGFQVRPTANAKKIAEKEQIEIRLYSIIYDAINDVKDAMEGMLEPKVEEVVVATVEVRQVFKISKVGTVAGCYVAEGVIKRSHQVRLIRDGIVIYTGKIETLKHLKEDRSEIKSGFECGISLSGHNDIKEGDIIEAFEQREIKRKL
ncbi:MAG: translation initiation factor IF-2 [Cytophagaceae bacterium]|nr:translation initiation factor IF-2 [Cytophagaceae bacterium]MDW8456327.1 translation initiation factor IF-2 [Cytophagaceae bacterium]